MTPDQIAQAMRMRLEGITSSVIARALSVTKNQVVGTLNRRGIVRPIMTVPFKPITPGISEHWFVGGCRWVIGDVRTEWRWCGAEVGRGESWCADHLAKGTLPGAAMPWRKLLQGIRK